MTNEELAAKIDDVANKVNILWQKQFGNAEAKPMPVFPEPCKYCTDKKIGKLSYLDSLSKDAWFAKIIEELHEAMTADDNVARVEEIADIITVCMSFLRNYFQMDEEMRSELFAKVNEKNRARGYLG